jgi:DNA primase
MAIPDSVIEEVRLRADIAEIISEHTRLKRSGKTFRGPCPLHGGEGPNFSVDPAKGFFKCFVCGEGGTVFNFLMAHLGMTYPEAIRHVAARVGVQIPDERERRPEEDPNRRLYEVNDFAAQWFRRNLWDDKGGKTAREYLESRGIGKATAERFGLGWAPEEWTAFGGVARKQGIGNDLLLSLGLVKEAKKSGAEPYDVFRGRIIFPIEDLGGRVVAFGGRILGRAEEHVPKYLNSPETPIYRKGDILYGLGWSRGAIRKAEEVLVVEGYMDYVSLAAHGVENVAAPLGTAMTDEQAELVVRYARRAILLYDSDSAGQKATFRTGDALLRVGVEVLVATLPDGEDPDSLVRGKGVATLRKYLDDAVDVFERKVQILERKGFFTDVTRKVRAIDLLLPTVRATSNEIRRDVYLSRIAEKADVSRESLERQAAEEAGRDMRPRGAPDWRERSRGRFLEQVSRRLDVSALEKVGAERSLLWCLIHREALVETAAQQVGTDDLEKPLHREIFRVLLHLDAEGGRDPKWKWLEGLSPEAIAEVEQLRGENDSVLLGALDEIFDDCVWHIRDRIAARELEEFRRQWDTPPPDEDLQKQLLKEHDQRARDQLKTGLGRRWGAIRSLGPG